MHAVGAECGPVERRRYVAGAGTTVRVTLPGLVDPDHDAPARTGDLRYPVP